MSRSTLRSIIRFFKGEFVSKPKVRYPLKFAILPGLKWRGMLTVECLIGVTEDGEPTFLCHFDAEIVDPDTLERFVFDRTPLTASQIHQWTGINLDPRPTAGLDIDVEGE